MTISLIATLAFTAACGSEQGSNSAAPAPTVTIYATPTPAAETTTPEPTETPLETPTDVPPTDSSGEPTESEATPLVLPTEVAGQPLTLSNIFKYPDGWRDGRYDIADRKQVAGIGGLVDTCGDYNAQTLELRLANNFSRLKLEFAESNSSDDSDQTLVVRIDANGRYQDLRSAKLNQIAAFDLPVAKVNALKIIVYLKPDTGCGTGSVEAVLTKMVLT
ncbi:hypothetical protein GCM10009554_21240 [Kribbella koreensis]|uniref:Glycosyl hydrolase family 98 putative carbohydrate-binding module domain-containing protein n=2 Tax=Kribbella TaxID=182639 RepID=A0ABP6XZI7_9ACTN